MIRSFAFLLALLAWPLAAWAQGPKGNEFQVSTYTTSSQSYSSVATDAEGNFVVVWFSYLQDGDDNGIFGQRFASDGSKAGAEFQVNTYTTGDQRRPSLAMDAAGNFVVVWQSTGQDGSGAGVFGQRFSSDGMEAGTEFPLHTFTTNNQTGPSVAMDPEGNFVAVWNSFGADGYGSGVAGRRFLADGTPLGDESVVNTYTTGVQGEPSIAMTPGGGFVVVWLSREQDGSGDGVFGQRFDSNGDKSGAEFAVNTYTTGYQRWASVATGAAGNFVVTWGGSPGQDGDSYGVFGQRFAADSTPLGAELSVNTYTTGSQRLPSVAMDDVGNFLVVWDSDQDGSGRSVVGRHFVSDGTPLGGEFQVNTYTTGNQYRPSVAMRGNGDSIVAWDSTEQSGGAIFGQLLETIRKLRFFISSVIGVDRPHGSSAGALGDSPSR